ncbi:carbohydrate ABC transporter permease [Cohnella soli]|uniref:Carbohydrate ABC transporter permease n=1 Tax=Cohnella soli TaxID=425005 RepID=A0ABW0HPU3_9BACL
MSVTTKRRWFIFLMLVVPVSHLLVFFVYININTIIMCFQKLNFFENKAEFAGLHNFEEIIRNLKRDPLLGKAVINSLLFIPVTNGILLPLSIVSAYILYKKVFLHKVYRAVFFFPSILSIVVMTMVFSFMFDSTFGVFNDLLKAVGLSEWQRTWFGDSHTAMPMVFVYCIWTGIGFNVILLSGAISRLPGEVIEYGQLEGISMAKELWQVVIPMIWPTITTVFVLGSTSAFTIFLQPQLLTGGGPNGSSYTIALYVLEQVKSSQYEYAAAVGVFFSAIGIAVVMAFKTIMEKLGPTVEY